MPPATHWAGTNRDPGRHRSTRSPRRPGACPQRAETYPRWAPELSTATRCSGATPERTTRSCVLGLTKPHSRRNVGGSLATPRRIAREAADQQVRTSAEDDHRAGSGGLIGSSSQLPDRGPASPNSQHPDAASVVAADLAPSRTPSPGAVFPSPSPDPSRRPTRRATRTRIHRSAAGRQTRPARATSTPVNPSIRR